jgi:hypothetical protein
MKKIGESQNMMGNSSVANKTPISKSKNAGLAVRVVEYDAERGLCKVVRLDTGKPLSPDVNAPTASRPAKPFKAPQGKFIKTLSAPDAPSVTVTDTFTAMRGNDNYGFYSFREGGGNIIKGPLSIAADAHQIRVSGITTLNPLLTTCFPSTIVTPMPTLMWAIPSAAAVKPLVKDVIMMGTLMSAMTGG